MILLKIIAGMFAVGLICLFWIVINAMTRPIYNKELDILMDDEKGRIIANWTIGALILVSFLLGYMIG
jgi:hypothetical protein